MNDQELARKIAGGDQDAAERFVREHYATIFRLQRHLTGKREEAEDLTQQTFVAARAKIDRFRGEAGLKTWLHRIAINEYSQWKRRRKQTSPLAPEHPITEPGFGSFIAGESLLSALSALSEKHRQAFILHEVEEMPVADIAKVLRVPVGTVKARLFHARKNLRALLEGGTEVNPNERKESIV